MTPNEPAEKALVVASLRASVNLIQGIDAGQTINAMRTRMNRIADDLLEAACEKL